MSLALLCPPRTNGSRFMYSVEEEVPEVDGETKPRRNAAFTHGDLPNPIADCKTLFDLVLHGQKVSENGPFLGHRNVKDRIAGPYLWESYTEVIDKITNVGAGLLYNNVAMGDRVGIYAVNCKEWYISQQACAMRGIIFVPLYDTHGADAIEFIIRQCDIRVMFTTSDKVVKIFENSDKYPSLSKIVVMDILSDNLSKIANEYPHIDIIDFDNIEADGIANPEPRPDTITQDTVVSICYTSGTRNDVKGAILTQGNYLSVVSSLVAMSEKGQIFKLQTSDIHMSYLPLPHIYEQTLHMIVSYSGARIGYYQGDVIKLMEDVQELKPTIFAAVPRMYNRIYERIQRSVKLKSIWSQFVFNYGILVKSQYIKKGYYKHSFLDKSVFEKIRHLLGGNVRALVCGAAPINPKIAAFFSICFSAEFTEGYGTTESCGLATNTWLKDAHIGSVGAPAPSCRIKLKDIPEMGYTSKDKPFPRGEILVQGPSVFKGYYQNQEQTEQVMDNGWLKTGDVGCFDNQGRLRIIDRKLNLFKIAHGEFIAPEKIENVYLEHHMVSQIFVTGYSLESYCVAIVVLHWDRVREWGDAKGYKHDHLKGYIKDSKFRSEFAGMLAVHGRDGGLKGFEIPKRIAFSEEPFSVENGLLTPTMKIKRIEAHARFATQVDALYDKK